MKPLSVFFLPLAVISLLVFAFPSPASAQEKTAPGFRAGAAVVDITPTVFPMQLRSGPSSYVHDPIHVRAIAFENGEGRAVIVLVDATGLGQDVADATKALAAEKTGWATSEILVCATHSHSTPKGGDTSPGRKDYDEKRFNGIVKAITQAIESLEPAEVGYASDEAPSEVYNRRWYLKPGTMDQNPFGGYDQVRTNAPRGNLLKPAGPTDPELCVVDFRTRRGKPLGLLANYALHYVGGMPTVTEADGKVRGMASADYFGEFSRVMPYRVGGSNPPDNFVAMMTNGTSGDINNIDFYQTRPPRAPFEQVRIVASKTADAAWRAVKKIETYEENPVVAMRERKVTLTYRTMSPEDVQRATEILNLTRKQREELNSKALQYANATLNYTEPDRTEDVIVQAIRIGDQAIVSIPFEVLVEIGLEIKEKSPFPHTFTIELANGAYGYLPPPNQHKLGGYETWIGTSRFVPESSVVLSRNLLEMLDELKSL